MSIAASAAITNPESDKYVSAASAWEIATKTRLGKLDGGPLATAFVRTVRAAGFRVLPITARQAQLASGAAGAHGDPFDRMLMAQALLTGLTLVSSDAAFDDFGVPRLW